MKAATDTLLVPSFLTQGMTQTDKESFEEAYRASAWVMRKIWRYYDRKLKTLERESEDLVNHEDFLKNAAERKAIRSFLKSLPEPKVEENG